MGNLLIGIKKFFQNKNIVTVFGAVLVIVILFYSYKARIKDAINPITVPYAKVQISRATQITEDMIGYRQVPPNMLDGGAISNVGEIIDKYTAVDTVIPKGSLFYKRSITVKEQLPNSIIYDCPKGYVLYNLPVNINTTFSNTIYPGDYIDIWMYITYKYADASTNAAIGGLDYTRVISNVKVLAVKDSSGNSVFQGTEKKGVPSMLIFALPEDLYILLRKATYLRTYDTNIKIIPNTEASSDPGEVTLVNDRLANFIRDNTAWGN